MTRAGWEPTTEAEVALYEALLAGDQERYFRVLGRVELLLPVSADAVAGRSPMGWATWTSNDHTHLLAFTSPASMRTCLAQHAGAARRMPFAELAAAWPNHDWWLAVNPGLPIEGYLPAWFVAQLSHGDARLPGQSSSSGPRDRLARVEALERAKAARAAGQQPPRDNREPVRVSATVGPRALPSAPPPPPSQPYPPQSPSQTPWHDPPWRDPAQPPRRDPAPATWAQPDPARRDPAPTVWGQPEPYRPAQPAPAAWGQPEPYQPGQPPRREPVPAAWTQPEPVPGTWTESSQPTQPLRQPAPAAWTQPEQHPMRQPPAAWTQPEPYPAAPPEPRSAAQRVRRQPVPAAWSEPAAPAQPGSAEGGQPEPRSASQRVRRQPVPAAWSEPAAPVDVPVSAEVDPMDRLAAWREREVAAAASQPGGLWSEPTLVAGATELPRRQPGSAPAGEPVAQPQPWQLSAAQTQPVEDVRHDSTAPADAEATRQSAAAFWRDGAARRTAAGAAAEPAAQSAADFWADGATRAGAGAQPTVQSGLSAQGEAAAGEEATKQSATAFWASGAARASAGARAARAGSGGEAATPSAAAFWADGAARAGGGAEATVQSGTPLWSEATGSAGSTVQSGTPTFSDAAGSAETVQTGTTLWSDAAGSAEATVQRGTPLWSEAPGGAEPTVQRGTPLWSEAPGGAEPTVQRGTPLWGDAAGGAEATVQSGESLLGEASGGAEAGSAAFWGDGAQRAQSAPAEGGRVETAPTTVLGAGAGVPSEGDQQGLNGRAKHAEPGQSFVPANAVEEELFEAAEAGNTDSFLSTLLLATVLIPKSAGTTNGAWRPQPIDGEPHIVCYTSTQHLAEPLETVSIKFIKLIQEWPDPTWSFAVNPGTPVGATLPGGQLLALANWAAEVGLGRDDEEQEQSPSESGAPAPVAGRANPELTVLQKAIAPSQVSYYLERGYDRVSGFVHRAHEVGHLKSIAQMRGALGLDWPGSPFAADANEIYLLRWSAYRPNLYRIPYGGNHEAGMKAMQGWVIERAPFRGNGFAPGENKEIIAEFKVDSARLPHGARLMRMRNDGTEEMIAVLDADGQRWLRTDGG